MDRPDAARKRFEKLNPQGTADRDPIWEELFTVRPEIVAGKITLSDRPGWGIELDERTLERRGSWA